MSVPDPDAEIPLLAVIESDAGRLFVAHAARHRTGFSLTAEAAPAIARICRELDGMPLAIALAAARVVDQAPGEIADGLADRVPAAGGRRAAGEPARPGAPGWPARIA